MRKSMILLLLMEKGFSAEKAALMIEKTLKF